MAAITTIGCMVRWEPGAAERLQRAALELFTTRGFEQTTAGEIARAVGLTERTFFRHFSDKREVLFQGQDQFARSFLGVVEDAPRGDAPMLVVTAAVLAAASEFPDARRSWARMRQRVIDEHPALRERERHKLAGLAASIAAVLRERGVTEPGATLAAEAGVTVFGIAFTQWIAEDEHRSLDDIATRVFDDLSAVVGAGRQAAPADDPVPARR